MVRLAEKLSMVKRFNSEIRKDTESTSEEKNVVHSCRGCLCLCPGEGKSRFHISAMLLEKKVYYMMM